VFTDSQYSIAVEKARAMEAYVKACSTCKVLAFEDSPIATVNQRMPGVISNLLQKYGDKLTYLLAIKANKISGEAQELPATPKTPDGPQNSLGPGDVDTPDYQRIRNSEYQAATVAEPIYLESWQLIDEINRSLAGDKASDFVPAPGLVTKDNVPSGDVFDPKSDYRAIYTKVWGK
jgi:ribose transport system substrate-binding protein